MNSSSRWPWLLILAIVTMVLGLLGFSQLPPNDRPIFEERLIRTLKFFRADGILPNNAPVSLRVARLTGALFTVLALVRFWRTFFQEQIASFHLGRWRGHVVICGLGRKGLHLLACCRRQKQKVAIAQIQASETEAANCRRHGAILIAGDATQAGILEKLRVEHAAEVYAVCGDDRTNFEIALQVLHRYRAGDRRQPLTCFVHLVDLPLLHRLQHRDFFAQRPKGLDFVFFNIHEHAARRLMAQHPLPSLRSPTDPRVHLILVGQGPAVRALILHHARTAHLGDLRPPRITILAADKDADRSLLEAAYPALPEICELTWRSLNSSPPSLHLLEGLRPEEENLRAVIVLPTDEESLTAAIAFRDSGLDAEVPVFVRIGEQLGLARLLRFADQEVTALNLITFGSVEDVCGTEVLAQRQLDQQAEGCHEAYRQTQLKAGAVADGNPSLRPWRDLPEDLKSANRVLADHLEIKRRTALKFGWSKGPISAEPLEVLARMEHNRWCAERRLADWRYSEERDNARRLHPCLVPWDELPESERQKDRDAVKAALEPSA